MRKLYETARQIILPIETPGVDYPTAVSQIATAVALLVDEIVTRANAVSQKIPEPAKDEIESQGAHDKKLETIIPLHLWCELQNCYAKLYGAEGKTTLAYPYFARDVLLACLREDRESTIAILTSAYYEPACWVVQKKAFPATLDFADAYQEACINLMKKEFDQVHSAQLFSIFFAMVKNRCWDQLRKQGQLKRGDERTEKIYEQESHDSTSFGDYITNRIGLDNRFGSDDLSGILNSTLRKIDGGCQRLLRLLFFQNLSYRDAAEKLNVKANGIGKRRERCLKKLADLLDPNQIVPR